MNEKHYLTKQGLERIKKEHEKLVKIRNAKVRNEAPSILHSEEANPEYLSFQEDMGVLEARIGEYENILRDAALIAKPSRERQNEVQIGATVVCEVEGEQDEFTLVGSLEANPSMGLISIESPVGKALLGHKVGEKVGVSSPKETIYEIKKIRYE